MPALAGIAYPPHDAGEGAPWVAAMLGSMARGAAPAAPPAQPSDRLAWGCLPPAAGLRAARSASLEGSHLLLDGEIDHGLSPAAGDRDAEELLRGFLRDGAGFLATLEGRFTAVIWHAARREASLVSDKFGSKPFFYGQAEGRLAFASEIKALLALPWLPKTLSRRGLVQFFSFGHLWNDDTFFAHVRCLDPATVATLAADSGRLHMTRYWRPRPTANASTSDSLASLDAQLKAAVDDRTRHKEHLGVSLSGGLDARTVLALIDPGVARPTCVSLGMEGSLDQRSARRLAELAGCAFHTLVLDQEFLANFDRHLEAMVALTDGHYLSQCIVMPTLPLYQQLGIRTLLRGHAGELVHLHKAYNFSVDDSLNAVRGDQGLHEWLYPRLQSHLTAGMKEPVLCGVGGDEFADIAHETLAAGLGATAHFERPADRVSQLFLDQRTHRETATSLAKIGSVADISVPYLDGRFVEAAFASPVELRIGEAVQTYMLATRRPEFLKPPNSNTGAPVGAGALHRTACYLRMKVLAKLGVKGYQPYERLGLWLRRELKPTVERLLLSPECLDRGVLEPNAVRGAIRRHVAGEQNHTFLLLAMMIVESGFRQFIDRGDVPGYTGATTTDFSPASVSTAVSSTP
jgi:asparagine synthase (glutamine-hydrolysing)